MGVGVVLAVVDVGFLAASVWGGGRGGSVLSSVCAG